MENKKFYIIINDRQQGPFSLDELKEKGIQKDTLVWSEGMGDWQPAGDVIELKSLFGVTPPPVPQEGVNIYINNYPDNKTNEEERIGCGFKLLFAAIAIVIVAVIISVCFGTPIFITLKWTAIIGVVLVVLGWLIFNDDSWGS